MGVIVVCFKLGIFIKSIKEGIVNVVVLGRCERVGKEYNLFYEIIIDYVYILDGFENILEIVKVFIKGKLIVIFGCGGDRDKVKRL